MQRTHRRVAARRTGNPAGWDPTTLGAVCTLAASVMYTGANACLRAVSHCDPVWVSCVKSFPTVVLIGPWLIGRGWAGEKVWPPAKVLGALLLAGLVGHLGGNVLFQWSLSVVGIALSVPLCLGTIMLGGALLGRVFLNEPVTRRMAASIAMLLAANTVLSWGAGEANRSVAGAHHPTAATAAVGLVAAGVAAACLSGLAYSVLTVVIRYGVTGRTSISTTMFTVGLVGLLSLGAVSRARIGMDGILSTGSRDLAMMLLAALCNTAGFLALIKALQLTTVVYVNAIGASQVAMSALAGVALFHEALSGSMVAGVAMTTLGLALVERGKAGRRSAGDAAQTGGDGAYSGRCPVEIDPAPPDEAPVLEAD